MNASGPNTIAADAHRRRPDPDISAYPGTLRPLRYNTGKYSAVDRGRLDALRLVEPQTRQCGQQIFSQIQHGRLPLHQPLFVVLRAKGL